MLAAGLGRRLSGGDDGHIPKSLLRFGGKTLLQRHVEALTALGIDGLVLVTGYRAGDIKAEIDVLGAGGFIELLHNPDYQLGSVLSLWTAREGLRQGEPVLVMDADVLYDRALLDRLLAAEQATSFPLDRAFEDGDEPVKLCFRDGDPVEFRKVIGDVAYDLVGEWPGFFRMSGAAASRLADTLDRFVAEGRTEDPYEEAVREILLDRKGEKVGAVDITGIPWIEIDFPEDVTRAETEILPRIEG